MMRDLNNLSILDLIPPNLKSDPQVQAAALAIDGELKAVTEATRECLFYVRINDLPEAVLDSLAWQMHVDFYRPDLAIERKRSLVAGSMRWHMRKGTPAAVEELVAALFDEGKVEEWWEYGGQPYHFKVITFNSAATNEQAAAFLAAVNSVKNARSVLEAIEITASENCALCIGCVGYQGDFVEGRQVV